MLIKLNCIPVQHDVLGLQISVNYPILVEMFWKIFYLVQPSGKHVKARGILQLTQSKQDLREVEDGRVLHQHPLLL